MLEPWSLDQKRIKSSFLHLVWKPIFNNADKIIFSSDQEYINFKKIKIVHKFPFEIIPNGFFIQK